MTIGALEIVPGVRQIDVIYRRFFQGRMQNG